MRLICTLAWGLEKAMMWYLERCTAFRQNEWKYFVFPFDTASEENTAGLRLIISPHGGE